MSTNRAALTERARRKPQDDPLTINLRAKRQAEQDFIDAFVEAHCTASQRERHVEGVLPGAELVQAMREFAFAPAAEFAPFEPITEEHVRVAAHHQYRDCAAKFRSDVAKALSDEQWAVLKALRATLPDAEVSPRVHEATLDHRNVRWGVVRRFGAMAVVKFGPFELRKEFGL